MENILFQNEWGSHPQPSLGGFLGTAVGSFFLQFLVILSHETNKGDWGIHKRETVHNPGGSPRCDSPLPNRNSVQRRKCGLK